jgi:DUF4097 and DUF4098 domain-containing protein YvlB
VTDSPPLNITTRSGDIRVTAIDGAALSVVGGTVEYLDDGTAHIRRAPSADKIEVDCASGTDVTIGTDSGKVELVGRFGAVRVATMSGTIRAGEMARIDVRTKSGKVDIGTCSGECRVMTKSAAVHIGRADRATVSVVSGIVLMEQVRGAEVKTVSGKVLLSLAPNSERVSVHTVSGKVEVRVPAATRPSTRLRTISGKIRCDCPTGDDLEIAVASVSGAIRVSSD